LIPLLLYLVLKSGWSGIIIPLKEDWRFFFGLAVMGIVLPNILQNYGMIWTTAHLSSIIQSSGPIFTILMAVLLLKEPLGRNKVLGSALALTGTLLLVTEGGVILTGSKFIGNFLVLMSAFSYSVSSVMSKKILEKYEPLTVAVLSMVMGTIILAIFSIFENPIEGIIHLSPRIWVIIILLGMLPGSLALLIWYTVLKTSELSKLILFIYLIPVFATVISVYWPGEVITFSTVLFALLIIIGVMMAHYEKERRCGSMKNRKAI
jgi:drug/metabolite transporter (DMT)-like permease